MKAESPMNKVYKINEAVRDIVYKNTLYQILVSTGLVNANALAREIKDSVEMITGKKVKINTIAKAITNVKPLGKASSISFKDIDVRLDTDVVEVTYTTDELSRIPFSSILMALMDGDKVKVLKHRDSESIEGDLVLLRLTFRGESVAYHPLWIIFNSLGIEVKHVIRHDNRLFIFMPRADAIKALSIIEKISNPSETPSIG